MSEKMYTLDEMVEECHSYSSINEYYNEEKIREILIKQERKAIKATPMPTELLDLNIAMMMDEHVKKLEGKILTWYVNNGKQKEFADFFEIQTMKGDDERHSG